jgi:hypothetical protein
MPGPARDIEVNDKRCSQRRPDGRSADSNEDKRDTTMTDTSFCEECGATLDSSARFCTECGKAVKGSPPGSTGNVHSVAGDPACRADGGNGQRMTGAAAIPDGFSSALSATEGLPVLAGLPLELWVVIAAFAIPGAWVMFETVKALPDAIKLIGAQFFGFRLGLALTMILVLVGLLGAAMLAIAWKLYNRDRVGRGLAYAFGGTIVISVVFSSSTTSAEVWATILSIVGIAILAFAPRVRAIFDQSAALDGVPTSVVVSRTLIAVFCALAVVVAVIYILLASISSKYVVAAVIAFAAAGAAVHWSKHLNNADRNARLFLSIGGGVVAVLLVIIGRSTAGLLFPLGLIVSAIGCLWLPNDARAFFGDQPLNLNSNWMQG